jgi:hypothetical protein
MHTQGRIPDAVGLEDAAAERCLVVILLRLCLDGSLYPTLGDVC